MNNNPLRQYFRRPSVYLRLPSGVKNYGAHVINQTESEELPVYPMTAIDEITVKTPDALYNGSAIVDLIKSCIPDIIDPWQIKSTDLDAMLVSIKAASAGEGFELNSTCPKCQEESEFAVQLVAILNSISNTPYDHEIQINELKFKFQPLTYRDLNETNLRQFEIQKLFSRIGELTDTDEQLKKTRETITAITELTMEVISRSITYIKTPNAVIEDKTFILDYLHHCDKNVYVKIRDFNASLKEQSSIKPFDITCPACSNSYKQPFTVNYTDFFD